MKSSIFDSAPLLRIALSLIVGIVIGQYVESQVFTFLILVISVIITMVLWRHSLLQSVMIAFCFVFLGIFLQSNATKIENKDHKAVEIREEMSRLDRTKQWCLQFREQLLQRYVEEGLEGEEYAVVAAMSLGDKSSLSKNVREVYSITGASHVLALSGLHIGVIYTLLSLLIVRRRWQMISQIICILSIWTFAFMVGLSASVVRSAIMFTVYGLLSLGHRDKMTVNTLAFTLIAMLIVNPNSLFDVGFQMSFMAVFSILIWMPLLWSVFSERYLIEHRIIKWVWGMIAVSIAAQMGVAPLIAYYFGRFSTYFLLTNFIIIPAATLILYLSLASLLIPTIAYLLIYIVGNVNAVLSWMSRLPGASIDGLHPTLVQVTMVYVIIGALWLLIERIRPARGWSTLRVES